MKNALLIILLACLFIAFSGVVYAGTTIVKSYPELPACNGNKCQPGDEGFGLPQFIKYIFLFALGAVGLAALLVIIIGGFGYLTAVGNPQKASDAKNKIFAALLGVLLLLGSYVILNTINPDLLKLGVKLDEVESELAQVPGDYTGYCCCDPGCDPIKDGESMGCLLNNTESNTATWAKKECKKHCYFTGLAINSKVVKEECFNEYTIHFFKDEDEYKNEKVCKRVINQTGISQSRDYCNKFPHSPICPYFVYCNDKKICTQCQCKKDLGNNSYWVLQGTCKSSLIK